MSEYLLELPDNLLQQAQSLAENNHISINQVLVNAINCGLNDKILDKWAEKADVLACKAVLDKIPALPVDELDEI